ncbi:cation efflux protein, CzcI family [Noviherbaspirillum aerium]|uniref:cation efflux protein, CzcI family n=1 Tax=Noviherbaspirillum aerium TaxID=2588497 RepID=UPI001CEFA631|nr:cation efflux protein, CzcI family [Noviherbaspirillum aerium]
MQAKRQEINANISPVKKLILILLLAVLPLQYAWAAAAAYCQHEQEQQTSHFGHHTHQHQAEEDDSEEPSKNTQADNDCGICQFSAQASFLTTFPAGVPPNDVVHHARLPDNYSSHIPSGPRKPDWRLVA